MASKLMDRTELNEKFDALIEMFGADEILDNVLRAMSSDDEQQQLEWFCNDHDIDLEEL